MAYSSLPSPRPEALSGEIEGIIDLAFCETNRWLLVDYKTDRVDGDLQPYVDYSPQVQVYAKAWERLSGQPVAEATFFFTHLGETCRVQIG